MISRRSTVTRKGQITIPADLRRRLGIEIGDQVSIELDGNGVHVARRTSADTVRILSGSLNAYAVNTHMTGQELIDSEKEAFAQAIVDDWVETERRMSSDNTPE